MGDTFVRTLHSVVTGARTAEELSRVLVSAAVEDALLCVARDYGHDYSALLRRYRDPVVSRHASGQVGERTRCRATGKTGKPCGKTASLQGYCQAHAELVAEEAAKRRKVEAYKASVPRRDAESSLVEPWLGRAPAPEAAFAVRPASQDAALGLL